MLTLAPTEGGVRMEVRDTGAGIPEKLLPKIFQPFFTTKGTAKPGESKGTGLGLAIVKEVAQRHGAALSIESPDGGRTGTRVVVRFPPPGAAPG